MPPNHSTPNRSGDEAHLGLPRAPPSLFRLDWPPDKKSQAELILQTGIKRRTFRSSSEDAAWTESCPS
ncbi:hypothetical protein TNIN_399731 [Trichonephila inaurata madagascariensis]|uniref:Uncharacterized protein n=1 Tax=Trichonephila inaurata madagascariensis TaxID=2747483 RepID=A0A8X6XJW5_9ARAC|nr:hypothetical protein TNIN_399731 [Trichonephila inaurata madagascariensis]